MDNNQREAMYDAWAATKKWVDVVITNNEDGTVTASTKTCLPRGKEQTFIIRDTKAQAIYAISGELSAKGYEISNLAEIQGIKS